MASFVSMEPTLIVVYICVFVEVSLTNLMCVFSSFQTTGRLKIGTYTGPLQHGIVYSGGKTLGSFSHV